MAEIDVTETGERNERPGAQPKSLWRPAVASFRAGPLGERRRVTLSEDIVFQVQQALFERRLRPGDFLGSEATLADAFSVSRVAARDALRALKTSGVITIRKGAGGGVHIASGNLNQLSEAIAIQISLAQMSMADIIDAQFAIVIMSAELAARNATDEQIARIEELLDRAETIDRRQWGDMVHEINLAIAGAASNPAVTAQMEGFMRFLEPFYHRLGEEMGERRVLQRYRAVLEAIRQRDPETALDTMYEHLKRIRERPTYRDHQSLDVLAD